MLVCGSLILTPKLCVPMHRGVLCRAFFSDSPLQGCPYVLMTPWSSGCLEATVDGLPVSSVSPHQQGLHIHSKTSSAFSGSQWTRVCWIHVCWQNLHARKSPVKTVFSHVQIGTSTSKQITAVTNSTLWTWLEAPCSRSVFAKMIILFSSILFFPLWNDRTFASRPSPKHPEVCFSAVLSVVWLYLRAQYRYLHPLQTAWGNSFNPAKSPDTQ